MFLLLAVLLIVAPALTYYVSTTLFYQNAKTTASGSRPPTIPYLFPGVFHAFSLAYDGPQKYFARLLKDYGSFAPFAVKAGMQPFIVIRDPEQMKQAIQAYEKRNPVITGKNMYEIILGSPEAVAKLFTNAAIDQGTIERARKATMRKYLEGDSLTTVADFYAATLSRNLNDKMFQVGTWTQIEDSWSFFQQVFTRCSMETLFGSAIFKQYPGLIKDYWKFEDAIEGFVPGMPWFTNSMAYKEPRDRLYKGIEKWLKANHSGTEFAKIGSDDADWDEYKGSKFIQERDDLLSRAPLPLEVRTAEMLDIMHCSNVDLIPSAVWSIIEVLRKPYLADRITTIVSERRSSKAATYDVSEVAALPLVQSLQAEVSRIRVAQYMTCANEFAEVSVGSQWKLPKACHTISFSHDIALDTKAWANARPRTVEKPLDEFWPERFLIPDDNGPKVRGQRKSGSGRFDAQDLELLAPIFYDQQSFGIATDYTRAIQAATLAVVMSEFEVQLCDPEATDAAMPVLRESAFGQLRPQERIAVRIRKRKLGKRQ
ncbi:hypothetical protein ACET3X_002338 [Alternaria dauci]|uniref:Uncharacterized protein n=1 Tax=Alternaria dauci TaxID=48095 RepID=A0ABR3UP93_9PLEO